jgi:2-aminomuconate deaminase
MENRPPQTCDVAIEQVTLKAMGTSDTIKTKDAPPPVGAYPHAKRLGNLLFLSGIGPRSPTGGPIPGVTVGGDGEVTSYDIEAQCHAVFANVRAVLESAGASWEDLVDVTVYLTDIRNDFKTYNRVYAEYFSTDGPTRTTVEVSRLPTPIAIELKCIAEAKPK